MSKYIIGVDGGGTKTLGCLFDLSGKIIKQAKSDYGNFNVNAKNTILHLKVVLNELTKDIKIADVARIQIGIAGYSNYQAKEQLLKELSELYKTSIDIVTDAEIALYSVKKDTDNQVIMVLGGTGSVVMVEHQNTIKFIGGFGHLLGDEGSGYHLSITALKNIIKQYEDNIPISNLSQNILKEINIDDYQDIKKFVYNNSKSEIAKLSQFIAQYAIKGDEEAIELFKTEGSYLAKQTVNAYNLLDTEQEVLIGIKGGFLLNAPYVKETLEEELINKNIKYKMDASKLEPVTGAYYLALKHLNKRWENG
jgi:N-acetylglucosamine kinase-like BadF-type ATPase